MKLTKKARTVARRASIKVGDRVTFPVGPSTFTGTIVEDRGLIGADGRRLYRIAVDVDDERTNIELPADGFHVVKSSAFTKTLGRVNGRAERKTKGER